MLVLRRLLVVFFLLQFAVAVNPQTQSLTRSHGQNRVLRGLPAASPKARPNVIIITLDTTRADRMDFLGSKRGLTPNLDLLAKDGIVFTRAFSHVPLTPPSHATILTGTYPQFNHVDDFGVRLGADIPYLPDILHARGLSHSSVRVFDHPRPNPGVSAWF